MSINGIDNSLHSTLGPLARNGEQVRPANDRAQGPASHANPAAHAAVAKQALRPQQPIAGAAATQHAVPAEAPAGTDPSLWSVLTSEERAFFAKTAALGPLTYGRIKAATQPVAPAPRGVRLDVRA
jgi:hypothetical protein